MPWGAVQKLRWILLSTLKPEGRFRTLQGFYNSLVPLRSVYRTLSGFGSLAWPLPRVALRLPWASGYYPFGVKRSFVFNTLCEFRDVDVKDER